MVVFSQVQAPATLFKADLVLTAVLARVARLSQSQENHQLAVFVALLVIPSVHVLRNKDGIARETSSTDFTSCLYLFYYFPNLLLPLSTALNLFAASVLLK